MASRFQVTPGSQHQAHIIELWAELEGRPVSALCASLLELGLLRAEHDGMMPQPIADALRFRTITLPE